MSRLFFDIELPLRALFEGPMAAELARVLAEGREVALAGRVPEPAPGPRRLLAGVINGLSEEELDRLLAARRARDRNHRPLEQIRTSAQGGGRAGPGTNPGPPGWSEGGSFKAVLVGSSARENRATRYTAWL